MLNSIPMNPQIIRTVPNSGNSWHVEETRDYYIRVESQWSNPPASYTLTVIEVVDDHANALDGATAVTLGTPVEGVMDWEDDLRLLPFYCGGRSDLPH